MADEHAGRIAVIGFAGRFPGAADVAMLWRNVLAARSGLTRVGPDDLRSSGADPALLERPGYVPVTGALDDVECFDAGLFGYSAREAALLDPQHRHFLEMCWAAMESAGYDPAGTTLPVGVFAGARINTYLLENLLPHRGRFDQLGQLGTLIGNDKDFLATNVSYRLGLTGPSLTVQTACSTSLVATHLACQSLLAGECDFAIAGGSAIAVPHRAGYLYAEGGIYSPDGRCLPFAADANGTVGGSGVAAVVLRRLDDAIDAGDPIRAVIAGSAVNNDGRRKVGYTAPGVDGQTRVIAEALAVAGVAADTIGYVETHGTGTRLGDPVEVAALTAAFRADTDRTGFCALGSVKALIGHLDAAAGVTGLIKAILAVQHGIVPPSPHVVTPNPAAHLDTSPFFLPAEPVAWPLSGVRRAGVSSFGVGGTNAHVVLQQAPEVAAAGGDDYPELIVVSARTATALAAARDALARSFDGSWQDPQLGNVAATLQQGRTPMSWRMAVVARSREEAAHRLADAPLPAPAGPAGTAGTAAPARPAAVFLLPGQGAQRPGIGRELYESQPVYRDLIDQGASLLEPLLGLDLRRLLHAPSDDANAAQALRQTRLAQPALYLVEYATAALWRSWGVRPDALVGHSLGEYVAVALAGSLTFEDGLRLVARRAALMAELPGGAMLAVLAPAAAVEGLLGDDVCLAAVNAPEVCVLSGPTEAIAGVAAALAARKVATRPVPTSHAFHSAMMDPVLDALAPVLAGTPFGPAAVPVASGLTGGWLRDDQIADPEYWLAQLRQPVNFTAGVSTATADGLGLLIEAGPGHALSRLAAAQSGWRGIATLGDTGDLVTALGAAGQAWTAGADIDWAALRGHRPWRRAALPTYPFARDRHWIDAPTTPSGAVPPAPARPDAIAAAAAGPPAPPGPPPTGESLVAAIATIWSELLGVAKVDATDNFYDLGGHSLLGAQLHARLRDHFAVDVALDEVLAARDLAALATLVRSAGAANRAARPGAAIAPFPRVPGGMPLSFPQQRLWVLERLDPGTPTYHLPVALRLSGQLDSGELSRAVSTVVARHEALRTRFAERDGRPVQLTVAPAPVALTPEPLDPADLDAALRAEVRRPLDLGSGRPVRFRLWRTGPDEHVLAMTLHHLVVDGWSIGVLVDELVRCYGDEGGATRPSLDPVALHCADVAAWQRSTEPDPAELAFWRDALAGTGPVQLPADRPRPAMPSGAGGRVQTFLDRSSTEALMAVGRAARATPYMTLLAALGVLLARLGGVERPVIGTPVANRPLTELEGVVGLLANTVPVPVDVTADPTFTELLDRVRESATAVLARQHVPFERIVDEVAPDRTLTRNPLFDVMLAVQNAPLPVLRLPQLAVESLDVHTGTAKFDLTFDATEVGGELRLSLEFTTDLWDESTARQLLQRYQRVLRAVAAEPRTRLHDLPVLTPEEVAALDRWSSGGPALPEHTITELVARQLAATPDAVAIVDATAGGARYTYAEIGTAASAYQARLADAGVRRGDRVALCLPRSARGVAAILAILRIGAAYVPLDPSYPERRLAQMLDRCGARWVLTADDYGARVPLGARTAIDVTGLALAGGPSAPQPEPPGPDDLAYVIFTSGSTGVPKGIGLHHRALANLAQWQVRRSDLPTGARTAQLTPYSFDVHFQEIFGTLLGGGTLVVLPDDLRRDPAMLLAALDEFEVARLFLPFVLLASLADATRRTGRLPAPLREVVTAGEQLHVTGAVREFFRRRPGAVLDNHYGPAETHVVTADRLLGDPAVWPALPAIGRPLPGVEVRVVDVTGGPAAPGAEGELWLGGVQLSAGYLDDPTATAQRFVATGRGVAYRTGDLARWTPDGSLEFRGRADAQVKIRGHRVEPAEVEAVLGTHPAVVECAVVAQPGPDLRPRLIGYATPGTLDTAQLRSWLSQRLPVHLVPSLVLAMPELPRTPSGKLDRRRLPGPPARQEAPSSRRSVRAAVDQRVSAAWCSVLGIASADASDNFFEAGGDSILAIQLAARCAESGYAMAPRDVFDHQSLGELSAALIARPEAAAQERTGTPAAIVDAALAAAGARAVRIGGAFDADRLDAALRDASARHPALRSRLRRGGPGGTTPGTHADPAPTVEILDADDGALLHEVDLTRLAGADAAAAAEAIAQSLASALDPWRGPVFGASLCRCPGGAWLTIAAHRSAVDDTSWPALLAGIARSYGDVPEGIPDEEAWRRFAGAPGLPPDRGPGPAKVWQSHRWAGRLPRLAAIAARHAMTVDRLVAALLIHALIGGDRVTAITSPASGTPGWHTGAAARVTIVDPHAGSTAGGGVVAAVRAVKAGIGTTGPLTGDAEVRSLVSAPPGAGPDERIAWWLEGDDIVLQIGAAFRPAESGMYDAVAKALAELANTAPASTVTPTDYPLASIDERWLAGIVSANGVPADIYPLTPMQRTMFERARAGGPPGLYAVRTVDALPAAVDPVALREAFAAVVDRHPILRTSFMDDPGRGPLQVVHQRVELPWTELDWRAVPVPELRGRFGELLDQDLLTPFQLSVAPLLRFTLIRLPGGFFELLFTGHHLLTDGWSRSLLLQDVPALYAAALARRPRRARLRSAIRQAGFAAHLLLRPEGPRPPLADLVAIARPPSAPPQPRPFRDHIRALAAEDTGGALDYWNEYLRDLDGITTRLRGVPDPSAPPPAYARCVTELSREDTEAVAAAARGKRLTVASVVQAAWALLLGRHTRAGEVMFGVTSSGRRSDLTGFDRMIGLFINTLPQRVSLDPPAPLAAIAAAIQADAVRARRFEHVALVDLERGLATADPLLFDSVVVVDNFPQDAAQHRLGSLLRAGHPFADVHADLGMTEFPLRLEVIPGDPMVLALCHYTDRYSAAQARALLVEYAELLITICADLDAPAATLLGAREPADAQPGVTGDS